MCITRKVFASLFFDHQWLFTLLFSQGTIPFRCKSLFIEEMYYNEFYRVVDTRNTKRNLWEQHQKIRLPEQNEEKDEVETLLPSRRILREAQPLFIKEG